MPLNLRDILAFVPRQTHQIRPTQVVYYNPCSKTKRAYIFSPLARTAGVSLIVIGLLIGPSATSAPAADLPARTERTAQVTPSGPTGLKRSLLLMLRLAKWLTKYVAAAKSIADSVEELLRLLDDASRSAEAHRKIIELEKKLAAFEKELSQSRNESVELRSLRALIKHTRAELSQPRARYRTCSEGQHRRADGACQDKRTID
jgi:hypothetical protein